MNIKSNINFLLPLPILLFLICAIVLPRVKISAFSFNATPSIINVPANVLYIAKHIFSSKQREEEAEKTSESSIKQEFSSNNAIDCVLGAWSDWSSCVPDTGTICGMGVRERRREVVQRGENAGMECPSDDKLNQQISCFKECEPTEREPLQIGEIVEEADEEKDGEMEEESEMRKDVTTVALLLDYQFNKSRQYLPRHFFGKNYQRRASRRYRAHKKYCVHYTIEWLNHNCVEREWALKLEKGQHICAECQPEAQYHRARARCASDLEDGQSGFWKLLGPPSCYGAWRRLHADMNDCGCAERYPEFEPFLLV